MAHETINQQSSLDEIKQQCETLATQLVNLDLTAVTARYTCSATLYKIREECRDNYYWSQMRDCMRLRLPRCLVQ
jgi:hypothetical protein